MVLKPIKRNNLHKYSFLDRHSLSVSSPDSGHHPQRPRERHALPVPPSTAQHRATLSLLLLAASNGTAVAYWAGPGCRTQPEVKISQQTASPLENVSLSTPEHFPWAILLNSLLFPCRPPSLPDSQGTWDPEMAWPRYRAINHALFFPGAELSLFNYLPCVWLQFIILNHTSLSLYIYVISHS